MTDQISPLRMAASGMRAQTERLRHTSENIANADTPGYRRKLVAFEEAVRFGRTTGEVQAGRMQLDQSALPRIHDPAHPMADQDGYYDGSNVDLVIELADSREARALVARAAPWETGSAPEHGEREGVPA